MKKTLKLTKILLLAFIFIIILFILIFYTLLFRSMPKMSGEISIPHINFDVKILRDNEGIPHIYAKTQKDANYALGYVMASDRLFQYDVIRRVGSGSVSELFGDKTLGVDILFRTLANREFFNSRIDQLPEEIKVQYQAFANGLNDYAKNNPLPIEYTILNTKPKEFGLLDAYYVYLYLAYSFSPMLKDKPMFTDILKNINNRNFELLTSNNQKSDLISTVKGAIIDSVVNINQITNILEFFGPIEGSNAWVIDSNLTKSHKPILVSDPHVTFSLPNLWYEAHVVVGDSNNPEYEFYGHFLPIIPFAAMGHNRELGWGLTMSYIDDMDLIKEYSSEEFIRNSDKQAYVLKQEKILIKGKSDAFSLNLKYTDSGPIIDHLINEQGDFTNVSLYWSLYFKNNFPLRTFFELSRSKNLEEVKSALSLGKSPGMNIIYGDKKGNIAHLIFGTILKRDPNISSDTIKKNVDFNFEDYDSKLFPHQINPDNHYLISTNDRPVDELAIKELSIRGIWYPKNRYDSVEYLLKEQLKTSLFDDELMKKIHVSTYDSHALKYIKLMLEILSSTKLNEVEQKAYETLKHWNYESEIDSVGASIYHHFDFYLLQNILDELSLKARNQYLYTTSSWYLKERLFDDPNNLWWDIKATQVKETMNDIVILSFKKTIADLENKFGSQVSNWQWGKLHTLEFPHPFGMNKYMAKIFNVGPFPVKGSINVINHFRRKGVDDGHKVKSGPSTRRIIDFSHPERSLGILPLGNSGHMLSPFYDNQVQRFLDGEYRYQLMNYEDIKKNLAYELTLKPVN